MSAPSKNAVSDELFIYENLGIKHICEDCIQPDYWNKEILYAVFLEVLLI